MEEEKIQEMQLIEQNLQNLLFQKQAFQLELSENEAALKELQRSGEDVFKIIGNLMIKTDKSKTLEDLENKKKLLELRFKSLKKQEDTLTSQLEKIREEFLKASKKK